MKLDVGCGQNKKPGFVGIDHCESPEVDIIHDLREIPWPIEGNAVDEMVLDNVIEHLPDTVATFDEMHRVAASGANVTLIYPYWRSFGAYGDPTHVRFFNEYMVEYFRPPGSSRRRENQYAFYTNRYWNLLDRRLVTWPGLGWLPDRVLSMISRHGVDVVHLVEIQISPIKDGT